MIHPYRPVQPPRLPQLQPLTLLQSHLSKQPLLLSLTETIATTTTTTNTTTDTSTTRPLQTADAIITDIETIITPTPTTTDHVHPLQHRAPIEAYFANYPPFGNS
jgi:hypothetical protein